ncbi:hypothetical protein ECLT68_0590 [Escherichia coli LT-68]|nr:hypothetical protein ECLT68_0590 [Escherichia coli LT-68]
MRMMTQFRPFTGKHISAVVGRPTILSLCIDVYAELLWFC